MHFKLVVALLILFGLTSNVIAQCKRASSAEEAGANPLCHLWTLIDSNDDQIASIEEIKNHFSQIYRHEVHDRDAKDLVKMMDFNGDGQFHLKEFMSKFGSEFRPLSPIVPEQLHLALTGSFKNEMRITWVTRSPVSNPLVRWGKSMDQLDSTQNAVTSTYSVGTFIPWVGWIHTAVMTNLDFSTTYFYQVGAPQVAWSEIRSFKTQPAKPSPATVAFYGDMGTIMPMGWDVAFLIQSDNRVTPYDLVVHAGDIAYAGTGRSWEFEVFWDMLGRQIDPIASTIPYMTAVGNHESYFNFTSFLSRFQMPSDASGGYKNFWLSFDHSYAHWIFMSTEHNYTRGSLQYQWLEQDMLKASKNRQNVPWIFLVGHRPMYASTVREYDNHSPGGHFPTEIEPLMNKYGIDLYLSGHDHCYERTWPQINGTAKTYPDNRYINPGIPAYILQGTAGAFVGSDYIEPRPAWSAIRDQQYGYGRITLFNSTTMHYEFLSTNTDSVRDDFWIIKK